MLQGTLEPDAVQRGRTVLESAGHSLCCVEASAEYVVSARNMPCKPASEVSSLADLPQSPSARTGCGCWIGLVGPGIEQERQALVIEGKTSWSGMRGSESQPMVIPRGQVLESKSLGHWELQRCHA